MFYTFTRILFRIVAVPMFRFEVVGADLVPRTGPAVVVAPHRSWLDPACVGGACRRPIRFLIVERIYQKPWARWFYRRMGAIPVRQGGHDSVSALRAGLRTLQRGELVGVFPEGRVVSGDLESIIHPGAALLAVRQQVPVIPVAIRGSAKAWPHGRRWPGPAKVRVEIRPPIDPPAGRGRQAIAAMVREIEQSLEEPPS